MFLYVIIYEISFIWRFLLLDKLKKHLDFLIKIDEAKEIFRHTKLFSGKRKENDAEHSWHISLMALILEEHSNENDLNMLKVIKMLLIHDLVEIYSGDYIVFTENTLEKENKEKIGALEIFGILPEGQREEYLGLWFEFEDRNTKEAKYARALDRLEPIMQNYYNNGGTWVEFKISSNRIFEKSSIIADGSEKLWKLVQSMVMELVEKGIIEE